MTIEISAFLTNLMNVVPEADTELAAIIRNQLIKQAVMEYGRDKPDTATADITGDAGKYYPINVTNLAGWTDEFSRISAIQYPAPAVASDETPVYLDQEDWDQDYYAGGVRYLWLPNHAPAATETMRVTYSSTYGWAAGSTTTGTVNQSAHGFSLNDYIYQNSAGTWVNAQDTTGNLLSTHQVTTVTDTDNFTATELCVAIPEIDFFAVCNKAACLVCQAISEKFSRATDSTITADSVNHTSKAGEFSRRAGEFCKMYTQSLGIVSPSGGDRNSRGGAVELPHAEFIDLDTRPRTGSREYLFRNRGTR